jgi:hypothetical protein
VRTIPHDPIIDDSHAYVNKTPEHLPLPLLAVLTANSLFDLLDRLPGEEARPMRLRELEPRLFEEWRDGATMALALAIHRLLDGSTKDVEERVLQQCV